MIVFDVHGDPKGQPRPRAFKDRGGNVRVYNPATAEGWKSRVAQAAKEIIPSTPLVGPLELRLAFRFARPKSHCKKNGEFKTDAPKWKLSRPDLDNCVKATVDCLMDMGFFSDDSQIVLLNASKSYVDTWIGMQPGALIEILEP